VKRTKGFGPEGWPAKSDPSVPSVSHAAFQKGKVEGRGTVFGHAGGFGSVVEKYM
jgi:hypothetical protein